MRLGLQYEGQRNYGAVRGLLKYLGAHLAVADRK
jgi:hypothetical protein